MKIAWYSPFSQRSAIAAFSVEVVEALQSFGHDVTIVRSEMGDSSWAATCRPASCEIVDAEDIDNHLNQFLSRFDSVIYNVGNHIENHYYCLKHQARFPGVTLLHDFILHHLLHEWAILVEKKPYLDLFRLEASSEALKAYAEASEDLGRLWFMSEATKHPVLRFALADTLGVVTHAKFYAAPCEAKLHCPVTTIPLAYPCEFEKQLPPPQQEGAKSRVITIGDVNVNKRCESVIRALGNSACNSEKWQYRVIGNIGDSYRKYLMELANNAPHKVDLELLGKVDEATLQDELKHANAISCLRYPVVEGASASIILSLASARPTLVSRGGCYDDIPDSLVHRIGHEREVEDLEEAFINLEQDYHSAVQQGVKARHWASNRHSGEQYARKLLLFLGMVAGPSPILRLADSVGKHLTCWNCSSDLPLIDEIEGEIVSLFGDP